MITLTVLVLALVYATVMTYVITRTAYRDGHKVGHAAGYDAGYDAAMTEGHRQLDVMAANLGLGRSDHIGLGRDRFDKHLVQ